MSLNRTKIWLFACSLQLALATAAHAQSTANTEEDFLPDVGDMQLFDHADASSYGNGPGRRDGLFIDWQYIEWAINAPDTTTVGRDGFNPVFFDGVGFGVQPNSLNTGFINSRLRGGSRLQLGYKSDGRGLMIGSTILQRNTQRLNGSNAGISFFSPFVNGLNALSSFVDVTGPAGIPDLIDDDLNGNNIYGRFGEDLGTANGNPPPAFILPFDGIPDVPAPIDYGDTVQLPIFFDTVHVRHQNDLWGIEVMYLWELPNRGFGGNWDLIGGVRYLRFREGFFVDALGKVLEPNTVTERILGVLADSRWDTRANNNLVGPQMGLRWSKGRGRWTFSAEGRFTAAANFQQVRQIGFIANPPTDHNISSPPTNPPAPIQPTPTNPVLIGRPVNLFPTAFSNSLRTTEFSPLAELRFDANYKIFRSLSVDVGFTYIFADNVARPSNMIDYQLPSMGFLPENNRQDLQVYGVNAGVNVSF